MIIKLLLYSVIWFQSSANYQLEYRVFSKKFDMIGGQQIYLFPDFVVISSFSDDLGFSGIINYGIWYEKDKIFYLKQNNKNDNTYYLDTLRTLSFLIDKNELEYWKNQKAWMLDSIQDDPSLTEIFIMAKKDGDPFTIKEQHNILFKKKFETALYMLQGRDIFIEKPKYMIYDKRRKKIEKFYLKTIAKKKNH